MRFGEKLSFLRKQRGMTQLDLAEKLDISRQAVSRWEQGTSEPSTENLISIGKLFDVSVDVLMNENIQVQAESAVKIAVKGQEPDEGMDFFRGSNHKKFAKQVVVACFVAVILMLITFLCYFGMGGSNQEPNKPVPVDELERGKLEESGAGELYLETIEDE